MRSFNVKSERLLKEVVLEIVEQVVKYETRKGGLLWLR